MNIIIEKILDKYFAKKFMDKIKKDLSINCFYTDKKITYLKDFARLQIKHHKYSDEHYITILTIPYNESFMYCNNYENIAEGIRSFIKKGGLHEHWK